MDLQFFKHCQFDDQSPFPATMRHLYLSYKVVVAIAFEHSPDTSHFSLRRFQILRKLTSRVNEDWNASQWQRERYNANMCIVCDVTRYRPALGSARDDLPTTQHTRGALICDTSVTAGYCRCVRAAACRVDSCSYSLSGWIRMIDTRSVLSASARTFRRTQTYTHTQARGRRRTGSLGIRNSQLESHGSVSTCAKLISSEMIVTPSCANTSLFNYGIDSSSECIELRRPATRHDTAWRGASSSPDLR